MGGLPTPSGMVRPQPPRLNSNVSEASFGNGVSQHRLRSQFSINRLNSQYDDEGGRASPIAVAPPRQMRSRSASQPSAYQPPVHNGPPPPLPNNGAWEPKGSVSADSSKRGSSSSQSTGDSSEYSPHSQSPITPFGSSDSSLAGSALRNGSTRHKGVPHLQGVNQPVHLPALVKVKVHFLEDIFVIQVPRSTGYEELVERVGRKIRLCGPRRDDGPLRVKYIDEDGDQVSIGSSEDVQMAFETMRPGNQITLVVS